MKREKVVAGFAGIPFIKSEVEKSERTIGNSGEMLRLNMIDEKRIRPADAMARQSVTFVLRREEHDEFQG
jgi:hypothetical protein